MVLMLAGLLYFLCLFISRNWRGWMEAARNNFGWDWSQAEEGSGWTVYVRMFGRSVYCEMGR